MDQQGPVSVQIPEAVQDARLLSTAVVRSQLMRLAQKGLNASEAAKLVGISSATARSHYAAFRTELLQRVESVFADVDAAYAGKRKLLHEMLEEQAYKSFEDLVGMLEDQTLHPALRVRINQDFMDRTEQTQKMARVAHVNISEADLVSAQRTAQEMDKVIPIKKAS